MVNPLVDLGEDVNLGFAYTDGRSQECIYGSPLSRRLASDQGDESGDEDDNDYERHDHGFTAETEDYEEASESFSQLLVYDSEPGASTPPRNSPLSSAVLPKLPRGAHLLSPAAPDSPGPELRTAIYAENSPLLHRPSIQFGSTPKPPPSSPIVSAVSQPSLSGSSAATTRRKSKTSQQRRQTSTPSRGFNTGSTYGQSVSFQVGKLPT